jgi:hypothetical protein
MGCGKSGDSTTVTINAIRQTPHPTGEEDLPSTVAMSGHRKCSLGSRKQKYTAIVVTLACDGLSVNAVALRVMSSGFTTRFPSARVSSTQNRDSYLQCRPAIWDTTECRGKVLDGTSVSLPVNTSSDACTSETSARLVIDTGHSLVLREAVLGPVSPESCK